LPRKLILDIDPGIDDAISLAIALFDPRLDILAVTATGGSVSPSRRRRTSRRSSRSSTPRSSPVSARRRPTSRRSTTHGTSTAPTASVASTCRASNSMASMPRRR